MANIATLDRDLLLEPTVMGPVLTKWQLGRAPNSTVVPLEMLHGMLPLNKDTY